MFSSLPHTDDDLREMLHAIGAGSVEDLFLDVPAALRLQGDLPLEKGLSEAEVLRRLSELAARNRTDRVSFLGSGGYDHLIPAVVGQLIGRSEFYTAYTPYQAEMSQGILQAIFEFQTLMCELTALEVANASLYDGHTAACEAASLALNSVRRSDRVLYSQTLHPNTRRVLRTHFAHLDVELVEIAAKDGVTDREDLVARLGPGVAAVILQSPNCHGYVEDLGPGAGAEADLARLVHDNGSLLVVSANPLSLGVLKPPGHWGADVAVGDIQPFGLPPYFGGPSAGYITARESILRKMPGRIVGQSLDRQGRRAFLLTLQAREQHIKRERATSNICSNQALAALAATVYLATVGAAGIREAAGQCLQKAHYLLERLLREIPAIRPLHDQPFFNEFTIVLPQESARVIAAMEEEGFYAGVDAAALEPAALEPAILERTANDGSVPGPGGGSASTGSGPGDSRTLCVAVTEARTREELDGYVDAMKRILK